MDIEIKPTMGWNEIKGEVLRKSIHLLVSLVPLFARLNMKITFYLLSSGIMLFTLHEYLRLSGLDKNSIITKITDLASRERDKGHIVLGPITLGLGALLVLTLFPEIHYSMGIYALAFGDGIASLAGKLFGKTPLPFIKGKSLQGSLSCFVVVFIAGMVLQSGNILYALVIAIMATILEMLPLKDIDNIIIPLGVAFISYLLF